MWLLVSPHLSDVDGLHNDVSIIYHLYISPPSLFVLYLLHTVSDRFFVSLFKSLVSLTLCTSCVGLLSLDMCIHFPRGLDWTGLDWTLPLVRNVTVSCYKLSRLLKLLPICSLPLFFVFFSCIYILSIHMYVAPLFRCVLVPGVVVER